MDEQSAGGSFIENKVQDWITRRISVESAMRNLSHDMSRLQGNFVDVQKHVGTYDQTLAQMQRVIDQNHEDVARLKTAVGVHEEVTSSMLDDMTKVKSAIDKNFHAIQDIAGHSEKTEREIREGAANGHYDQRTCPEEQWSASGSTCAIPNGSIGLTYGKSIRLPAFEGSRIPVDDWWATIDA